MHRARGTLATSAFITVSALAISDCPPPPSAPGTGAECLGNGPHEELLVVVVSSKSRRSLDAVSSFYRASTSSAGPNGPSEIRLQKGTGPKPLLRPSSRCPAGARGGSPCHKKKTGGRGVSRANGASVGIDHCCCCSTRHLGQVGGCPSSIRRRRMVWGAPSLPSATVVFYSRRPGFPEGCPCAARRRLAVRGAPGPPGATVESCCLDFMEQIGKM